MQRKWVYISEKRLFSFEKWWEALRWQTFYQNSKKKKNPLPSLSLSRTPPATCTHEHESFGNRVRRRGSVRALCCWRRWRPQRRQLPHGSPLLRLPFPSSCTFFGALADHRLSWRTCRPPDEWTAITGDRAIYVFALISLQRGSCTRHCQQGLNETKQTGVSCCGYWHFEAFTYLYIFTHVLLDVFKALP